MLSRHCYIGLCVAFILGFGEANGAGETESDLPVSVQFKLLNDLGGEHIARATYRRVQSGRTAIVGWGDRILEWPRLEPGFRELVPAIKGFGYSNGGCALDLDGDGADELIIARGRGRWCNDPKLYWFQQTASGDWSEHLALDLGPGSIAPHDILPISFEVGTKVRGVAAVLGRRSLEWYEVPAQPAGPWIRHEIATLPRSSQSGLKVGDVAGHGRADILCGTYWVECPADPLKEPWAVHRFSEWNGGMGGMDKLELADMDGDGRMEIVAAEAEIPNSRLAVFTRDPRNPNGAWKCEEIERGLYCPHSLIITDLDQDGRPDIVVGEMTAGGWSFPLHDRPRIIAYFNRKAKPFERHVLWQGEGVHEMDMLPRRDGGPVILFAADEIQPQKFPDMRTHVGVWTISPRPWQ